MQQKLEHELFEDRAYALFIFLFLGGNLMPDTKQVFGELKHWYHVGCI
jgi:hypothetical protein